MEPSNEQFIRQQIYQQHPDLDESQVERVLEIALAHSLKNQGRLPAVSGIVRLVLSQTERCTPITREVPDGPAPTGGQAYTGRRCPC